MSSAIVVTPSTVGALRVAQPSTAEDVPPMALDAEAAVIADCLLEPSSLEVVAFLRPEHFWHVPNRYVFAAMCELAEAKKAIDVVTIAKSLREQGRLEAIGGIPYMAQLVDSTPAVENVEDHARIVLDRWKLRRLGELGVEFARYCRGQRHRDAGEVLERAQKQLASLAAEGASGGAGVLMGDAVRTAFQALEGEGSADARGVPTGFVDIDAMTAGLRPGQLWVLGARPGRGKTSLSTGVALNVAFGQVDQDGRVTAPPRGVAFFSLEMLAPELAERVVCAEARVDYERFRHRRLTKKDWDDLTKAAVSIQSIPLWIEDTKGLSVFDIKARASRKKREFDAAGTPLGLVVVDYLQLVKARTAAHRSREQEVAEVSRELKAMAGQLGCAVLALAQLSRDVEKQERPPRPSDLRESGQVEQDADLIAFLHEDKNTPKGALEFLVRKQRSGRTGSVLLAWRPEFTRFDNFEPSGPAESYTRDDE